MLENIAFQYVNMTEQDLRSIAYGLIILGAVVAAIVTRSRSELRRAPYFAFSALLVLAGSATQFVWLGSLSAMAGGYLWVLMAVDVLGSLVIGYFFGVIAMARARDAFGHGRFAVLAFIPLANFVLLLKASKNEISANRIPTIPLVTGGLGVLSGFVMLAAGIALPIKLMTQIDRMVERAYSDPAPQAAGVEFMIGMQGLKVALAQMAAEVAVPTQVDEVTTLVEIETNATTLRYLYTVDTDGDYLLASFKQRLIQNMCANEAMGPVLRAGGVVELAYYRLDGREIGTVVIALAQCGSGSQTRASVEHSMLNGPASETFRVIKLYAPREFEKLVEGMIEIQDISASYAEAYEKGANMTASLRREMASFAHLASDESIRAAIEGSIDALQLFDMDRSNCNRFVIVGPIGLPSEVVVPHAKVFDSSSAATFRALLEGRKASVTPNNATDEDWQVVAEYWVESGATDSDIASASDPRIDDPNLCSAMIGLLRAILNAEGASAARVRAAYVAEAASK